MTQYTVKQGDTLLRIAKQFKLDSSKALYMHADNAAFRSLRPNPDVIYPGDVLNIPEKPTNVFSAQTNRRHRFVVCQEDEPEQETLQMTIKDSSGSFLANAKVELKIGEQILKSVTDKKGNLAITLPETEATEGELSVYSDETSAEPSHQLTVQFAHLDPIDTLSGIQARCNNLGYFCGTVDGVMGNNTRKGIMAFQAANGLTKDGEPGPKTQRKLLKQYGC